MGWIVAADVVTALGLDPAGAGDDDWLDACVDAANFYLPRRRYAAGYVDDPEVVPGPDVKLATVEFAKALYRNRGTVDAHVSFEELGGGAVPIPAYTLGLINRLAGIPRPVVV